MSGGQRAAPSLSLGRRSCESEALARAARRQSDLSRRGSADGEALLAPRPAPLLAMRVLGNIVRFLDTIVRPTLFWGLTAVEPTTGLLRTLRRTNAQRHDAQGPTLVQEAGREGDELRGLCCEKMRSTLRACKLEGWETVLVRNHWRLMEHLGHMFVGSICFAL